MNEGWVKFYRQFYTSEISHKPPHFREVFIWLIVNANHKPGRSSGRLIQRGQLVRSYNDIREALYWEVGSRKELYEDHQIKSAIRWLKKVRMITTTKTTRGSVITICEYDLYQSEDCSKTTSKTTGKQQENTTINKKERIKEEDIPIIESDSKKIAFNEFWTAYDKKVGLKSKIEGKWDKLSDRDQQQIMDFIPKYEEARPDKQFRRNPEAFLNNRTWEDELIYNATETNADLSVIKF